ncbi:PREDICTED: uncharacterized protein LOC104825684 [Tarenaya hassleriana]|uniref:uncharacterized protein LOC104825684 n=1 Tax=Tarenaya hassleriana TaxID=28532 RepID=UPI00053C77A2|nr:PREDICTED: uncharacterized protein LOC104825684 [Tarenaya hassleriana]
MGFMALQPWWRGASTTVRLPCPDRTWGYYKFSIRACSDRKSLKKSTREARQSKNPIKNSNKSSSRSEVNQVPSPRFDEVSDNSDVDTVDISASNKESVDDVAPRDKVLQACTVTSGLISALGLIIRQVSHFASTEGLPIPDSSMDVTFGFEIWHLEMIGGMVIFITSCRLLLLKSWPDFAESSNAANRQVLSSLEPLDYLVVSVLPGVSEEILFRGALLPLFGTNWIGIVAVGAIFGFLHLGSNRKFSFAIWATFVGIVYGYATVLSSSLFVPMASHALNNLAGGILWRYTSKLELSE